MAGGFIDSLPRTAALNSTCPSELSPLGTLISRNEHPDTNVIAELMLLTPNNVRVVAWIDAYYQSRLYLTSITLAETLYGIECMPMTDDSVGFWFILARCSRGGPD
ncbi:MAG: PIN domain-containing protein [Chloroflexia bacterium]|nr:PIN domain-containing protein [Chloroflexia bacterium]